MPYPNDVQLWYGRQPPAFNPFDPVGPVSNFLYQQTLAPIAQ